LMDAAPERVVVVACTNRPNALDLSMRRAGRFQVEVRFPLPTAAERARLLESMLAKCGVECTEATRAYAENACVGFSAADLMAVARHLRAGSSLVTVPLIIPTSMKSATRLDGAMPPPVVVGQTDAAHALAQAIEWPIQRAEEMRLMGLGSAGLRGVLLFGPPGCAKTSLVRAVMSRVPAGLFSLSAADVYACGVGEAEAKMRQVFADARMAQPSVVFLDELDALVGNRRGHGGASSSDGVQARVLSTLLNEMDGCEACDAVVVVVGATNRPWDVDDALLRPGRFDRKVKVMPPPPQLVYDAELARMGVRTTGEEAWTAALGAQSAGMSGADVMGVCRHAAVLCVERGGSVPDQADFEQALRGATRSAGPEVVAQYTHW